MIKIENECGINPTASLWSQAGSTMKSFVFTSSNNVNVEHFDSLVTFDDQFHEWFEVVLANEKELFTLLDLLGISNIQSIELTDSEDFVKLYDYSSVELPELSEKLFDMLYEKWLAETGRESDMDEYGQLIFIRGKAKEWNKNSNRIILQARP